jgi:O-antigen/teichoic acid export membrane protein
MRCGWAVLRSTSMVTPGAIPFSAAAPAERTLGTKIARSVLFGGLRYVLITPVPFLLTPLILRKIGPAGYGTWAVFLALNSLTALADLGLVGTLSKFVAEYYANRDFPALERLLSSGVTLFLLMDCVVGVALWAAAPVLTIRLFRESSIGGVEICFLLRCFIIVLGANIFSQLFASVIAGVQRLDLTSMISAANVLLSALFGAMLLLQGWGLRGLVYGYVASALLTIGFYFFTVRHLLPQVAINPTRFDSHEARKMFGYSLRLYITQAAVVVHNQVEKIFLAVLVGVAPVGWYDIASDTSFKIRGAIGFILNPILSAASELNALGDETRMGELYYRAHKFLALFGVPSVCFVVAVSGRFIELWLGPSMRIIAIPLSVLLVANFFNLASGPGFLIFAGRGHMAPGIRSALFGLIMNVFLSLALIYRFGFAGAVVGTSVSVILASGYFVLTFHRETGYQMARVLREGYLKPTLCSVLTLVLLLLVCPVKNLGWAGIVGFGCIFLAFYVLEILCSQFFDAYDWVKIEDLVPAARYFRRVSRFA